MRVDRARRAGRVALLWAAAILASPGCTAPEPKPAPSAPVVNEALEREMRDIQVVMFMTEWCPHCRRARAWLRGGGYSFIELDVEEDARAAEVLQVLNPRGSVPLFDVDGQILVGFDARLLRFALRRAVELRAGGGHIGFAGPE